MRRWRKNLDVAVRVHRANKPRCGGCGNADAKTLRRYPREGDRSVSDVRCLKCNATTEFRDTFDAASLGVPVPVRRR